MGLSSLGDPCSEAVDDNQKDRTKSWNTAGYDYDIHFKAVKEPCRSTQS